jgi:ADP-ribose pyrophosphatase
MASEIEVLERHTGYEGFLRLDRFVLRHGLFAGGRSVPLMRERLERLRAVAVLPYDPALDRVVLVEQFRIGALEQGPGAWLLEIVGGMWDPQLQAEEVARREAREECGCALGALWPIGDVWMSPGTSCERVMLYCGRVDASRAGGVHGLEQEGEDIRVVPLDLDAALAALAEGRVAAATAVIALQWLALHRERVRQAWSGGWSGGA